MDAPQDPVSPQVKAMLTALEKVGVEGDCPSCHQTPSWTIVPGPVIVTAAHGGGVGFAALALVCPVCGFVRLHSAAALDRLMDPRG